MIFSAVTLHGRRRRAVGFLLAGSLFLACGPAQAILFYHSGDPSYHTSPPEGALTNSGWQWETTFASNMATMIASNAAISAVHVGWRPGSIFTYEGLAFTVTAVTNPPKSDLQLMWFAGRVPSGAPLYTGSNEVGSVIVTHGRGGLRGDPVYVTNSAGVALHGWGWAHTTPGIRWGANVVTGLSPNDEDSDPNDLILHFGASTSDDPCTLSGGDSGGGAFIRDTDGEWKLAGINYAVEGPYNFSTNGPGFDAAIFDRNGLFESDGMGGWVQDPGAPAAPWSVLVMTRVSTLAGWVRGQLANPPPLPPTPRLLAGPSVEAMAEPPFYSVDPTQHLVVLPWSGGAAGFFQLVGASALTPPSIDRSQRRVTLHYVP